MVHGRYIGWAEKPLVAVDIFRVRNGKLVEHWDVMQEEVPASATASGNPCSPFLGEQQGERRIFDSNKRKATNATLVERSPGHRRAPRAFTRRGSAFR